MNKDYSEKLFKSYKEKSISGRYINLQMIEPLIKNLPNSVRKSIIGKSIDGRNIHCLKIGNGKTKILMWSQMHGNESTTTKAIFDLLSTLLNSKEDKIEALLKNCTLSIIPMLNPDGAETYTRFNANEIDLNRDAVNLSQSESRALRKEFEAFNPHWCFNLHGQRTIFSAGEGPDVATVSFLSPTQDEARSLTENRQKAMSVIVAMQKSLEEIIPNSTGVYDDSFNINCVGDYFQAQGVPTVLFEAGHYRNDYDREEVRYFIYHSFLVALSTIASNRVDNFDFKDYQLIPQNNKLLYDIIIRNASIYREGKEMTTDIAVQYEEQLQNGSIHFQPKIEKIGELEQNYGHREIDFDENKINSEEKTELKIGYAIDFVNKNNERLSLKLK